MWAKAAHRVEKWIVGGDDAHIRTIQCREESQRVGETGMVRDKQDRTAPWDPVQASDLHARGEVTQGPARRVRERTRGESSVCGDELARDSSRRGSQERARGGTARTAMFPAKRLRALACEDAGE